MKVLIVCNNAYYRGNGLCTAVLTLYERLHEAGIEARIMACANPDPDGPQPEYPLGHFKFPLFENLIYASGFRYAAADRKLMRQAIAWADVVHLEEGFPIEGITARIAQRMGKPCVGSYHLFTENILANLGMKHEWLINHAVNLWWRKAVYDRCAIVHCPTFTVRDYLRRHHFRSELRVVSNGISLQSPCHEQYEVQQHPYLILCTGRFANEKSQGTLLQAMRYSRHSHDIQLHFAGKGPKLLKYLRQAGRLVRDGVLTHPPVFGFYDSATLAGLCRQAYLYIHCAWVEVEGLSCVEALREGAVPVIAKGRCTATAQFALDDRSTFPQCDARALAQRIDWWIEHPAERAEASRRYADLATHYDVHDSTAALIAMYQDAVKKR